MLLTDRVVIVTGAGSGIGEGIVRVCVREGAYVVAVDVQYEKIERLFAEFGERLTPFSCDIRDDEGLSELVRATVKRYGRIDSLVNNAGVNCLKAALETEPSDWDRVLDVDLRAAFILTQKVCRQMLQQRPVAGSIVNIASVHTHGALPASVAYDAAKWGVIGFTKSMAIELAPLGIRINAVSPGLVATQIWEDVKDAAPDHQQCEEYFFANIPIMRTIEPVEIGEIVSFLLCDRSRCIVGANIFADGGMSSQLLSRPPFDFSPIDKA